MFHLELCNLATTLFRGFLADRKSNLGGCMSQSLQRLLLISLMLLMALLLNAAERIYDIQIEGNQNVDKSLILSAASVAVGDFINPDQVAKTIKNLNNLSVFEDISIDKEPFKDGVTLIIKVREYPIVHSVTFSGNKQVKTSRIDEITTIRKGSYWSPFLKNATIAKLRDEYNKKGYYLADISTETTPLEQNRVAVTFKLKEGSKVAIKRIVFHGNNDIEDKTLLGKMKTKPANLLRQGKFEQDKFDKDMDDLVAYYNKKGYIDARIVSTEVKQIDDRWQEVNITIEEGQKFLFGSLKVKGNTRFTEDTILSKFSFKAGDLFDMDKFNRQLSSVSSLYYEEGYIYARFDHELEKSGNKVNIILSITENTRAKVREIKIVGNKKTKEKVIRRQLEIAPGDYFQQSKVIRSQQNIYNLGFFEPPAAPDYEPINRNGDIDLTLNLQDKTSGTANGGVGYNSQDNFVGQFSLSMNNLFGNYWQTSVKWEFGGSTQNFEWEFTNPYLFDTDILTGYSIYHTQKEWTNSHYEISTQGASVRIGKPITLINKTNLVAAYAFYSKKYRITDRDEIDEDAQQNLIELDSLGWRNTSSGSFTISRDTRDNVFFPTAGSQFTFYTEVAGGPFQGDFSYFKQIAQVSWFTQLYNKLVLRSKWRLGYVHAYGSSDEVPPDEKFFPGGTGLDGIRGYGDRSVGPVNGGDREIIYSSELAYPFGGDSIVGLLFFDAGNSYDKLRDFNFLDLKKGAGLGIRIRSPFGLIGFDYARNFEENSWEPHFQFGTTF